MTRKQMEQKIEELSEELRQLKAKGESHGHCHGCHCGHVIWYSYQPYQFGTASQPVKWYTGTNVTSSGGNFQISSS